MLIDALSTALESNATTAKNALEKYIAANGGTVMPLTDAYGKTHAEDMDLGLYMVVETSVPEMVVSTTDPFLVSLPMTDLNGSSWIYDVTLYPKNLTGIPTLEKTLRESKDDTGKHSGSGSITDGYAHTGTASDGDVIDYQLVSTLPSITSESTYLEGLFATLTNVNFDNEAIAALIKRVSAEKEKLVPNCAFCASPCGRNNDYDMQNLWTADADIRSLKSLILFGIRGMAAYAYHAAVLGYTDKDVNKFFYKALFAVGMDWEIHLL